MGAKCQIMSGKIVGSVKNSLQPKLGKVEVLVNEIAPIFFEFLGLITQNLKPGPLFFIIFLNATHFSASIARKITKIGLKLQEIQF